MLAWKMIRCVFLNHLDFEKAFSNGISKVSTATLPVSCLDHIYSLAIFIILALPNELIAGIFDKPRLFAASLGFAYYMLLAVLFLACCVAFLWFYINLLSRGITIDDRTQRDEEDFEEQEDLEFGDDTDDEYARRPY